MRYFVTGATGLVGGRVTDRLLAGGNAVRVLVRRPADADALRRRGADARLGDLAAEADLPAMLDGVDVAVHCAGVVQVRRGPRDLRTVNVEGTERLAAAAAQAGLGRFVHLSSVAVYGVQQPPVAEDAPKHPVGAYGKSKWGAEELLWQHHRARRLPVVVLRPCIVYGGRDRHAYPALARLARLRLVPLPDGGRRLLDLVHVSDVVQAVIAAASAPSAVGRAYNVTDGQAHSYRDILIALGRATGRRPAIVPVPTRLWGLAARVAPVLRGLGLDLHYAIDAARRDLAYRPQVGLDAGLGDTFTPAASTAAG